MITKYDLSDNFLEEKDLCLVLEEEEMEER